MKNSKLSFKFSQINAFFIFLFLFLLPTQLGKHFFLNFSYISGVKIDYLSPTLFLTDIFALILFLINIKLIKDKLKDNINILSILFILFFINILIAKYPLLSFYRLLKLVEVYFIFIIFSNLKLGFRKLTIPFLLGGILQITLALTQFVKKASVGGLFYFLGERFMTLSTPDIAKAAMNGVEFLRPYGTFSHPNSMAGFYLLLYFYFLTKPPGLNKWLIIKYISLLIFSFLILISFSKTAIIVFLVLNIIYLILKRDECRICPFSSGIIFFVVSLIFLQVKGDPASIYKRFSLFSDSLDIISKNLFFGTGLGHYLIYQANYPIKFNYFFLQPVHNIFLLFFAETGLILFSTFFYFLIKFIKKNLQNISYIFCLFVILTTGMVDHYWLTLQQNLLLIGVVFGIIKR